MEITLDQVRNNQLRAILQEHFGAINEENWQRLVHHIEWIEIRGGEQLFAEGSQSVHFFMVVSGRMQALKIMDDGRLRVLNEIGRGESIGEMSLLTDAPRSATIMALRDSVLIRIKKPAFQEMLRVSENMMLHLYKNLISRLNQANRGIPHPTKIQTIAVVGISPKVDVAGFCRQLEAVLSRRNRTIRLDSTACHAELGQPDGLAASDWNNRLTLWMNEQEATHEFLIYEADPADGDWMNRCLRHADLVFMLADATHSSDLAAVEKAWLADGVKTFTAHQYLLLIHPPTAKSPENTLDWLRKRSVERHFHLRAGLAADVERLARFVQGRATGLVLAGGGARGMSHIGIYHALVEHGIPMDMVGGTSAGAIVGGMIARLQTMESMLAKGRHVTRDNPTSGDFDLLPMVSLMKGKKLRWVMSELFEEQQIEDLWNDFFCVSSNMTQSGLHVHRQGLMRRAIQASTAIPGVFPPVVYGNDLHIDGGVMNNLPIDVMRELGAGKIIAADLDVESAFDLNYADMPTARQILGRKILGKKGFNTPSIVGILMKSAVLGSNEKASQLAKTADLFLCPDLKNVGFAAWNEFDRIVRIGYEYGRRMLENVNPDEWK